MSRKSKKKKKHSRPAIPVPSGAHGTIAVKDGMDAPRDSASPADEVRSLLASGRTRGAVERAKEWHKAVDSQESFDGLIEAYRARIEDLALKGMVVEATALLDLVRQRHPTGAPRLAKMAFRVNLPGCSLADLVGPLADPELPAEQRAEIEDMIRRECVDLEALALCEGLPADHALRRAAAAVSAAFRAVTSGSVADDAVALPEVSRRSPLASWKMLVRAIHFMYRRNDEECLRCLAMIDPASGPARLAHVVERVLGLKENDNLSPAQRLLEAQVRGDFPQLRVALTELDRAMEGGTTSQALRAISDAVSCSRRTAPHLSDRIGQRIVAQCALGCGPTVAQVYRVLDRPPFTAHFWHLMARAAEDDGEEMAACRNWEEFRKHALHSGLFSETSAMAAALDLRMAWVLRQRTPSELRSLQSRWSRKEDPVRPLYEKQPPDVRAVGLNPLDPARVWMDPEKLYARAARAFPNGRVFVEWMSCARQHRGDDWRTRDEIAEHWHRALPDDARPLLLLAESAEKRDAFQKALKFLETAETLDALNPEVQRTRWRLWIATAMRHGKQKKVNLLLQDIETLDALPQSREGGRPAFLAALRWLACVLEGDTAGIEAHRGEAVRALGGELAAVVLFDGLADECGLKGKQRPPLPTAPAQTHAKDKALAVARVCALGDDVGVAFDPPASWAESIAKALLNEESARALDGTHLRVLAEGALRVSLVQLAYAATAEGLRRGGPQTARFLLLRAQSLPSQCTVRSTNCLVAAIMLARRVNDLALVEEAVELGRQGGGRGWSSYRFQPYWETDASRAVDPARIEKVVKREKLYARNSYGFFDDEDYFAPDEKEGHETEAWAPDDEAADSEFPEDLFGYEDAELDDEEGEESGVPPDFGPEGVRDLIDHLSPSTLEKMLESIGINLNDHKDANKTPASVKEILWNLLDEMEGEREACPNGPPPSPEYEYLPYRKRSKHTRKKTKKKRSR